jgi:hypothetical protein
MNEEISAYNSPITSSSENKIQLLKARKMELLLRKKLAKTPDEVKRMEDLLKAVDKVINKHNLATTIRRRMTKNLSRTGE